MTLWKKRKKKDFLMMKNDVLIYFDILTSLKTTSEIEQLASEIDTLVTSIFKANESFDSILSTISASNAQKIRDTFRKNSLDTENKELIRNFLQRLKNLLTKFKIIRLTIAFNPSDRMINNIHSWISQNLGLGFILHIEANPEVLGGAIIVYNGKYRDLSLSKAIEKLFTGKYEQMLQLT